MSNLISNPNSVMSMLSYNGHNIHDNHNRGTMRNLTKTHVYVVYKGQLCPFPTAGGRASGACLNPLYIDGADVHLSTQSIGPYFKSVSELIVNGYEIYTPQ